MVSLTNKTTASPSVTDVSVATSSQTNTVVSTPSKTNINSATVQIAGYNTEEAAANYSFYNRVVGPVIVGFPGGYLKSFQAFIRYTSVPSEIKAAIYVNGSLFSESIAFTATEPNTDAYWQTFDFTDIEYIPAGELYLVISTDGSVTHFLRCDDFENSDELYINIVNSYTGSFPSKVSSVRTTPYRPQIYIEYYQTIVNNVAPKPSTWNEVQTTWATTSNAWETFVDDVNLTNV